MNVWVDEYHGFATIQLLHGLLKLRIAEETIRHAPHEHESVTLQCVERISSLSNGVTDGWKRNTREKPEAIGIFAYDACGILVTSTRQLSGQSGVTEINPRRSNRSNRGLDIVAIHHFERSAE